MSTLREVVSPINPLPIEAHVSTNCFLPAGTHVVTAYDFDRAATVAWENLTAEEEALARSILHSHLSFEEMKAARVVLSRSLDDIRHGRNARPIRPAAPTMVDDDMPPVLAVLAAHKPTATAQAVNEEPMTEEEKEAALHEMYTEQYSDHYTSDEAVEQMLDELYARDGGGYPAFEDDAPTV